MTRMMTTTTRTTTTITSPEEYAKRFMDYQSNSDEGDCTTIHNLCGRLMKGRTDDDFDQLSEEPGKVLSWVCSCEMLSTLLGKNPVDALLSIGKHLDLIQCRINDQTRMRLVVFPLKGETKNDNHSEVDNETVVATWSNLWDLIAKAYGSQVDQALQPFKKEIEKLDTSGGYATSIRQGQEIDRMACLPVSEKHAQPGFLSARRFLSIPVQDRTIYHARGFLDHSVGCNYRFTGTGYSPDGDMELLTINRRIADILGAVLIPLNLTQADWDKAAKRMS